MSQEDWEKHTNLRLLLLKYGGYGFQRAYRTQSPISNMPQLETKNILNNIPELTEHNIIDVVNDEIRRESIFRKQLILQFGQEFGEKCFTASYPKECADSNTSLIGENLQKLLTRYAYAHVVIEYDPEKKKCNVKWKKTYTPGTRSFVINLTVTTQKIGHAICAVLNKDDVIDIFDPNGRIVIWPMSPDDAELSIGKIICEHIYSMCGIMYKHMLIPKHRPNINFIIQDRGTCATWSIFMLDFYATQDVHNIDEAIHKLRKTVPLYVLRTILTNYASWIFKKIT